MAGKYVVSFSFVTNFNDTVTGLVKCDGARDAVNKLADRYSGETIKSLTITTLDFYKDVFENDVEIVESN